MIQPTKISSAPSGINIGPEYSKLFPWSKDCRWLLLQQSGGWTRLHMGETGVFVRTLPSEINTSSRPRWSRFNPDSFTFIGGYSLFAFDVVTSQISLLRTFPEYAKIDDSGEADLSIDGNHRVFAGTKEDGSVEVFVYDMAAGQKGMPWVPRGPFDGLSLTSDNRILISEANGIFVGGNAPWRKVWVRDSHACPCVYEGRPALAVFDGNQHLRIVDIETAQWVIVPFVIDWAYTGHVSSCDKPFLIVSLSDDKNKLPGQIIKISLDDLSAEVLCEFATVHRDNDSQPNASLSRDGSRVVFRVDDGSQRSAWMLKLDADEKPVPIVLPNAVPGPNVNGLKEIDFTKDEGREWWWHFRVVNGKIVTTVYDK